MKRLAIPTTLVPALMPNAMDTALMFVIITNRKYVKNLDALSWNPVNMKGRSKLSMLRSSDTQFNLASSPGTPLFSMQAHVH